MEEIEIFRLFRKVCDIDSGGLRAEVPAEDQAGASVIAAGIGYVDPDAVETVFAGLKRARFLRRALTGPGGCSFARTESAVEEGGKVDRLRVDAGAGEMQLEVEFQFPEFHRFRVFPGGEEPELVILFAVPEKLPDEDEVAVPGDGELPLRILHGDGLGGCVKHLFRLVLLRHGDRFPVDEQFLPLEVARRQPQRQCDAAAGNPLGAFECERVVDRVGRRLRQTLLERESLRSGELQRPVEFEEFSVASRIGRFTADALRSLEGRTPLLIVDLDCGPDSSEHHRAGILHFDSGGQGGNRSGKQCGQQCGKKFSHVGQYPRLRLSSYSAWRASYHCTTWRTLILNWTLPS